MSSAMIVVVRKRKKLRSPSASDSDHDLERLDRVGCPALAQLEDPAAEGLPRHGAREGVGRCGVRLGLRGVAREWVDPGDVDAGGTVDDARYLNVERVGRMRTVGLPGLGRGRGCAGARREGARGGGTRGGTRRSGEARGEISKGRGGHLAVGRGG